MHTVQSYIFYDIHSLPTNFTRWAGSVFSITVLGYIAQLKLAASVASHLLSVLELINNAEF